MLPVRCRPTDYIVSPQKIKIAREEPIVLVLVGLKTPPRGSTVSWGDRAMIVFEG